MCYKKSPYSHNKFLKTVDKKFVRHVFLSLKTIPCSLKERTVFKNSFQTGPWNMARAILALSFHQSLEGNKLGTFPTGGKQRSCVFNLLAFNMERSKKCTFLAIKIYTMSSLDTHKFYFTRKSIYPYQQSQLL